MNIWGWGQYIPYVCWFFFFCFFFFREYLIGLCADNIWKLCSFQVIFVRWIVKDTVWMLDLDSAMQRARFEPRRKRIDGRQCSEHGAHFAAIRGVSTKFPSTNTYKIRQNKLYVHFSLSISRSLPPSLSVCSIGNFTSYKKSLFKVYATVMLCATFR